MRLATLVTTISHNNDLNPPNPPHLQLVMAKIDELRWRRFALRLEHECDNNVVIKDIDKAIVGDEQHSLVKNWMQNLLNERIKMRTSESHVCMVTRIIQINGLKENRRNRRSSNANPANSNEVSLPCNNHDAVKSILAAATQQQRKSHNLNPLDFANFKALPPLTFISAKAISWLLLSSLGLLETDSGERVLTTATRCEAAGRW